MPNDPAAPPPVVLALDGNSLVHRGYHALAHTGSRTPEGEPMWAVRGLLVQLVHAVERIAPNVVVAGFDDAARSVRREQHPDYKAHRPDKLPTLVSQLELAARTLERIGVPVVVPPGLEADDVLASAAATVRAAGGHTVLVTSDRDAFALVDDATSVLRIINGGVEASPLITPSRLELLTGVRPEQYRDLAALRGDPSDNLPGVAGVGPKIAARLLQAFGTARAVFDDVAAGGDAVRERVGRSVAAKLATPGSREAWERNCEVMTMHADVRVDLSGTLPLEPVGVRRAYRHALLPGTLPRALRVLSEVEAPTAVLPEDVLGWNPNAEWRSRRTFPPLPPPEPDLQLTLF